MTLQKLKELDQWCRWARLAPFMTGESHLAYAECFSQLRLRELQIFSDAPDFAAYIAFHCSQQCRLSFSVAAIALSVPYALATDWTEFTAHRVKCQRLTTVGQGFILGLGHHFRVAASRTFHDRTSLRLELDDRRSATSEASDLNADGNSVLRHAVIDVLPHLMVCMRSHRLVKIASEELQHRLPHLRLRKAQSESIS